MTKMGIKYFLMAVVLVLSFGQTDGQPLAQGSPFDMKYRLSNPNPEFTASETTEVADITPVSESTDIEAENNLIDTPSSFTRDTIEFDTSALDSAVADTVLTSALDTSTPALFEEDGKPAVTPDIPNQKENAISAITKKNNNRPLFLFLMLIAAALLTTLTISSNKNLVNNILRAVFNDNYLNLIYRQHRKTGASYFYILYFVFAVNAGLFLYFLFTQLIFSQGSPTLWRCVLIVSAVYGIRHLFMNYLAYVYPFKKEIEQFAFTILIFNIFLGLILLPINVFVAFSPSPLSSIFLYIGLGLSSIVYVFRQLRGVFISSRLLIINKFYFLLYLCAVEIAPALLLIKYVGAYVS